MCQRWMFLGSSVLMCLSVVPRVSAQQPPWEAQANPAAEPPESVTDSGKAPGGVSNAIPWPANSSGDNGNSSSEAVGSTATAPGSRAQSNEAQRRESNPGVLLRDFFVDEGRMWSSPFHFKNYDSHTMEKYGLPFVLASSALIATDRYTTGAIPSVHSQTFIWSGRVSQIGAPYTLAAATATLFCLSRAAHEDHLTETGLLSLEALAHSQLIALGLKEMTQRERPADPVQPDSFSEGGSSFPSGHTTGSFAVATVFAYEYGREHLAVPIIGFSLASVVASARVSGRQHWVSDVFVGSALGFMEGRYVYKHHHDRNLPGSSVPRVSRLIPIFDVGPTRGSLFWTF
jgi:membrane-associated phospholipid phosphatase